MSKLGVRIEATDRSDSGLALKPVTKLASSNPTAPELETAEASEYKTDLRWTVKRDVRSTFSKSSSQTFLLLGVSVGRLGRMARRFLPLDPSRRDFSTRTALRYVPPHAYEMPPLDADKASISHRLLVSGGDDLGTSQVPIPQNPTRYRIDVQDALDSETASLRGTQYYSHEMYRGPDGRPPSIHYCRTRQEAEEVSKLFLGEKLLGLDLEWRSRMPRGHIPTIKESVSLLQLASEGCIALFHFARFSQQSGVDLMPPTLKRILQSPSIIKVGANIKGDCTRIRTHLNVHPNGIMELSHLYKIVRYSVSEPGKINKAAVKLAHQVEEHLGYPLDKPDVRTSDWSKELNAEQKHYAAADAYCAVHLYDVMNRKRLAMLPTPDLPEIHDYYLIEDERRLDPFLKSEAVNAWLRNHSKDKRTSHRPLGPQDLLSLRLYAAWHLTSLDIEDMQSLQTSMSLNTLSMAYFILDILQHERFPHDPTRTKKVLAHIPRMASTRYKVLLEDVEKQLEDRFSTSASNEGFT